MSFNGLDATPALVATSPTAHGQPARTCARQTSARAGALRSRRTRADVVLLLFALGDDELLQLLQLFPPRRRSRCHLHAHPAPRALSRGTRSSRARHHAPWHRVRLSARAQEQGGSLQAGTHTRARHASTHTGRETGPHSSQASWLPGDGSFSPLFLFSARVNPSFVCGQEAEGKPPWVSARRRRRGGACGGARGGHCSVCSRRRGGWLIGCGVDASAPCADAGCATVWLGALPRRLTAPCALSRGAGKVHGSLARAGKVKGQTPKVRCRARPVTALCARLLCASCVSPAVAMHWFLGPSVHRSAYIRALWIC